MDLVRLKLEIIAKIIATNDVILLNRIKEIMDSYEPNAVVNEPISTYEKTSEKIYIFNEWQQKRIDIALKRVENGDYLTQEEDDKEMQRWFKEEDERLTGQ